MNTLKVVISVMVSTILLNGCVSQKESMIQQGYPLAYADGFDDGCHSGRKAGGSILDDFRKDVTRFSSDTQYAQGWSDGFRQCETEQEAIQRKVRISLEQLKLQELRSQGNNANTLHLDGIDTSNFKYLK